MSTPLAMPGGDAFPLMKAGSTTVGQNTQSDFAKLMFQGLMFAPGSGGYAREGVLSRANHTGGQPLELKVLENGNAQSVAVNPGLFVVHRGRVTPPDQGVRWGGANGTTPIVVNMPAAPGTNTRYDGVFSRILDKSLSQDSASSLTDNGPYLDVVSGAVGASLNPNATPGTAGAPPATPDGYLPLAYVARATSDNTIAQADILDVRRGAMIAGTPRVMFPFDIANLATDTGRMPGEERWRPASANYDAFLDRWDGTTWRGTRSVRFAQPAQTFSGALAANVATSLASGKLTIPWPGFPYKITAVGEVQYTASANGELFGEINLDSDTYTPPPPSGGSAPPATALGWSSSSVAAGGRSKLTVLALKNTTVSDGVDHVLSFWAWAGSGNPSSMDVELGYSYKFNVEIHPA